MIVHIVMFKFKEENREANIAKTKEMLEALVSKIEPLVVMEVGVNFVDSERAFDLSLYSTFENEEGLEIYRVHPEHLKVVAFIKAVTESSKVVDYIKA
ncbi:MAG: Dabb family protein [Campylobacterota bacterium]|nr:Dabb family protein [Campylobacterota bacterium]